MSRRHQNHVPRGFSSRISEALRLHTTTRMERLSLTYIWAVAAYAGYDLNEPKVDCDSIDGVLISHEGKRPRVEFQAKATYRDVVGEDEVVFDIPIKNYSDLIADVIVPRYLIVVVLPECEKEWLSLSEEVLAIRKCGYWFSLRGMEPSENTSTVRLHIPRTQQFSPDALRDMMRLAEKDRS